MRSTAVLLCAALISACGPREAVKEEPPATAVLFPASEVCTYPALGPGKTFSKLAGGNWSALDPRDANSLFECCAASRSVRMVDDGTSLIQVDFSASGVKDGASMISFDYMATGSGPIPNESTYRNVFVNLVDSVIKQGLKNPPPELFRRKISNLKSYSPPGKGSAEAFDIGAGFVTLSREASPDGQSVNISVKIYPDVAFKLE